MKKPSVPRPWLFFITGGIWSIAALILIERAYGWIVDFETDQLLITLVLALALALVFYLAGFKKIVRKNISRINSLPENVCIFAFTAWKGYLMIILMVISGILLRSSKFPRHYLALLYLAMAYSLLAGGINFFIKFYQNVNRGK